MLYEKKKFNKLTFTNFSYASRQKYFVFLHFLNFILCVNFLLMCISVMYVYIPQASLVLVDVQREHQIFETRLEDTSEKLCGFL